MLRDKNGKEYKLNFTAYTLVLFERKTGVSLLEDSEAISKMENAFLLCYLATEERNEIEFEEFLQNFSPAHLQDFAREAVSGFSQNIPETTIEHKGASDPTPNAQG